MFRFIKKNKTLLLLVVCLIAVGEGVYSGFAKSENRGIHNRLTSFVMSQYRKIDAGEYEELSENIVEGRWEKKGGEYVLTGILEPSEIESLLIDDLGVRGWRIRFVILKPHDFYYLDREEFARLFPREFDVLNYVDQEREIEEIPVVVLTGHVTGRCSIVDWVRPVPVVRIDDSLKMIIRGMPEVYYLIHKEQWFKPVRF